MKPMATKGEYRRKADRDYLFIYLAAHGATFMVGTLMGVVVTMGFYS